MKIKTKDLIGPPLDWAVAKCEGTEIAWGKSALIPHTRYCGHAYSTDWAQGGPIIEREGIGIRRVGIKLWRATFQNYAVFEQDDNNPLIAAMRCYVASKLGDEVEVPEELTTIPRD